MIKVEFAKHSRLRLNVLRAITMEIGFGETDRSSAAAEAVHG
jgi:hypothetical protein